MSAAVAGLRRLADSVPVLDEDDLPPVPFAEDASVPRAAAPADALFALAALSWAGVLPEAELPWREPWLPSALRSAAAAGSLSAALAAADRALHGELAPEGTAASSAPGDCAAGLPAMRAAADAVLRTADAAADHGVPKEPTRLRDRVRDGAWRARAGADENSAQAVELEAEMAQQGVAEAQRHLGYRRLLGRGVPADAAAAAAAFEQAAQAGDEYAAFNLGYVHMRGLLGGKNFSASRALFQAAAAKELPAAFNGLGVLAFNGWGAPRNYTAAREAFEEGAARGDPDAHYNLGMLLHGGYGVAADPAAALAAFEAASEAGHWRAPHTLASMHAEGVGTPPNCTRAARLLGLFVEERLGWALRVDDALAAYDSGDWAGALALLAPLAAQGCDAAAANAAFILRAVARRSHPAAAAVGLSPAEALSRAEALWAFAAARGSHEALVDLGDAALARHDSAGAQERYLAAAGAGVAEGSFRLGSLHLQGRLGARNLTAARRWFTAALEQAPTPEAGLPPMLALLAVRALAAVDCTEGRCAAQWDALEAAAIVGLTLALAVVLHLQLRLRRRRDDGMPE